MDADPSDLTPQQRVGQLVIDRRAELEMNQADLIRASGTDPRTVRDLERGARWPRDATKARIERALHWPLGTLDTLLSGGAVPADEESDEPTPIGETETAARLVLAMEEVQSRLHASVLTPEVVPHLPPGAQHFIEQLDYATQLAETLAVTIAGGGEELARLKREERARIRSVTWGAPSAAHMEELRKRRG
ncbi:hypothetical protein IU414_06300 [Nocardia farcinica]|uniref:helix-turn-helix transcriptional regulator n=1 Tax=Nocardia farcinica TaxID=37329 RepID=UPI0018936721|nr:helix-turn-helix transcriptional regulator [Nocardia farcinica]MBF6584369.1 hypothetical protein [Nocardia farcinica]